MASICQFFAMYGYCSFAERCSFLHRGLSECDRTASAGVQPTVQEVSKLREEVKNLRIEIDRLRKSTDTRLRDAYENQKHLLEMVKDLKEELDVDKATRVSPAGTARPKVEEAKEQIVEEVNEGDLASPAWTPPASCTTRWRGTS